LAVSVNPANMADSVTAQPLIVCVKELFGTIKRVLADSAYDRTEFKALLDEMGLDLDTTSPPLPKGTNFVPRPVRWVVEQYFGWLTRWRRIGKNYCYKAQRFTDEVRWCVFATAMKRATSSV
jgi:transposase